MDKNLKIKKGNVDAASRFQYVRSPCNMSIDALRSSAAMAVGRVDTLISDRPPSAVDSGVFTEIGLANFSRSGTKSRGASTAGVAIKLGDSAHPVKVQLVACFHQSNPETVRLPVSPPNLSPFARLIPPRRETHGSKRYSPPTGGNKRRLLTGLLLPGVEFPLLDIPTRGVAGLRVDIFAWVE